MPIELTDEEISLSETNDSDPRWAERAESVFEALARKSWAELEAVEHADYLLFPEKILKRRKGGKFEEISIMLRVPRKHEIRKAHVDARAKAAKEGIDPEVSRKQFDDLENLHILQAAIRNNTPPYEVLEPDFDAFERMFDAPSLDNVWGKLESYRKIIDPTPELITREAFLALVAAIAESRNIGPLAVISGRAQTSFVVSMAVLLTNFLQPKSSPLRSEISTAGASHSPSSTPSSLEGESKGETVRFETISTSSFESTERG